MMNYTIKTHKLNRAYDNPHFFILNKGRNAGRPMKDPCPNCFVVETDSEATRDKLFYLIQALQIGKHFSYYIKGSVIPFIVIGDTRYVIDTAIRNYDSQRWQIKVDKLKKVVEYENNLKQQLTTITQLKMALLRV